MAESHPTRDAKTLPSDACPRCAATMRETRGELSHPVNGQELLVPNVSHLRCPQCDEVVWRMDDARHLRARALELYRDQEGLLAADEIRGLRERFGLTQGELARLLRLGANTISRWEVGRSVQTAALDVLLRLIRDLPESLPYLRRQAA